MFWSSIKTATLASVMTASLAGAIALAQQDRKAAASAGESPRPQRRLLPRRGCAEIQ